MTSTEHRGDPEESSDYCNVNPNSTPGMKSLQELVNCFICSLSVFHLFS